MQLLQISVKHYVTCVEAEEWMALVDSCYEDPNAHFESSVRVMLMSLAIGAATNVWRNIGSQVSWHKALIQSRSKI